ncbi:Uncharacterised protein [Yersinia enterocolitica]|nr:Uncharacterised protein [Yersinia enterocolitica]
MNEGFFSTRCRVLDIRQLGDALGEADALFIAAIARVADTHRPDAAANIAEFQCWAVAVGFRPFTAEVIKAKTLAVAFVTKLTGKAPGIKVWAALAVFMNQAAVSKGRAVFSIQCWWPPKGNNVGHSRQKVMRIRRAAGDVNHGFAR